MKYLTDKQRIIFETALVLGVMLLVKDILDRFNTIGAGSIAMWSGIFIATYFMRKQDISWKDRGLTLPTGKKQWISTLGIALITSALVLTMMAAIVPLISSLLGFTIPESSTDRFEFLIGNALLFIAYLIVVIWLGAAVGEELLMRGFLLNNLRSLFGQGRSRSFLAVLLHSTIFGMLHISQGVPGVIATGIVGAIFAIIYLSNNQKLFPLIIAHGIVNSIGLTAYFLSDGKIT